MANSLVTNPVVINTIGSADIVINPHPVKTTQSMPTTVSSIVMEDTTAADTAVFYDNDGVEVLRLSVATANASEIWTPAKPFTFQNGLILDYDGGQFATGGYIFIYLA